MRAPVLLPLLLVGCADAQLPRPPGSATVERVIDGDTIDVTINGTEERVRLLGIDTPESKVEGAAPECYGVEAAALTAQLLPVGTAVRLERDVVGRDDYGRLLAFVYRAEDNLLVNAELVRLGYAELLRVEPNGLLHERLVALAAAAERSGLGLWGACGG